MWETWVWSLGWEDLLEKGMATHSSILAWKIPRTVESMGSQRVRHDQATLTHSPMALSEKHRETLSSGNMGHIWLACVSLVPESGIEPGPPKWKHQPLDPQRIPSSWLYWFFAIHYFLEFLILSPSSFSIKPLFFNCLLQPISIACKPNSFKYSKYSEGINNQTGLSNLASDYVVSGKESGLLNQTQVWF